MKNLKSNKQGFTLIELVVVIVILGILALIAIPSISSFKVQAELATCQANQRTAESEFALALAQGKSVDAAMGAITVRCPLDTVGKKIFVGEDGIALCDKHTHAK